MVIPLPFECNSCHRIYLTPRQFFMGTLDLKLKTLKVNSAALMSKLAVVVLGVDYEPLNSN